MHKKHPKIVFKLLDNNRGVILTRSPEVTREELTVCFKNAPQGATAIFHFNGGRELYREIVDNACSIDFPADKGEIKVGVAIYNGSAKPQQWKCEQLKYKRLDSGEWFVCPNDGNIPQTMTEILLENEDIRKQFAELEAKYKALEERFNNMMEGYDLM